MKIIEQYQIKNSNDTPTQFKFKQHNEAVAGGYLTGVATYREGTTRRNGWTQTAFLVLTNTPWVGSDEQYSELKKLAWG